MMLERQQKLRFHHLLNIFHTCVDLEGFVRDGPTLTFSFCVFVCLYFLVGSKYKTISGPPEERQRNIYRDGTNMNSILSKRCCLLLKKSWIFI